MPSPTPIPSPPPPAEGGINLSALLSDLTNPDLSLTDIAESHTLSLEELTLLLTQPDIAEKLANLHTLAVSRTRLIASALLPRCITALNNIITHNQSAAELDAILPPNKRRSPELTHRANESTRRAATRIIQLSNFNPPRLFAPLPSPKVARLSEPGAQTIQTQVTQARVTQARVEQALVAQASRLCASESSNPPVAMASHLCEVSKPDAQPAPRTQRLSLWVPQAPARPIALRSTPVSPASLLDCVGASTTLAPLPANSNNEHWP